MVSRKLGRGLDLLIGRRGDEAPVGTDAPPGASGFSDLRPQTDTVSESNDTSQVRVVDLDPKSVEANPSQPRKKFSKNELEGLKTSISQEGLLQPVLVRSTATGYQLIAGERRLRAAQELDLQSIPAIVSTVEEGRMLELALIENIQRQDLNPIEVAEAYRQLMDHHKWTQEALARALGVSRSSVANSLRLLELPEDMQSSLVLSHISAGHAKVLLSIEDAAEQRQLFERIAEERLTVRELEAARDAEPTDDHEDEEPEPPPAPERKPPAKKKPARIARLEEELTRAVGTKVSIQEQNGRGKLTVEFYSADDFERLRGLLKGGA